MLILFADGFTNSQSLITVPLKSYQNLFYTVDFALGTPGQNFTVMMDTLTADFWVPS